MPRTSAVLSDFPKHGHDHRACGSHALAEAEAICHSRGARLTDLRRKVLETIWEDLERLHRMPSCRSQSQRSIFDLQSV